MTLHASEKSPPNPSRFAGHVLAVGGLLLAAMIVFADVLARHGAQVLSMIGVDGTGEFIAFRSFAFSQLLHGHVPLWNPYIFGGAPFLANFQSAMLYPPNLVYLCLPLNVAFNVDISFHVTLAGFCMYAWCAYRGLHPLASLVGGLAFMFGGAFYAHVYAGQLAHLAVMAWAPLVFLAVDDLMMTHSIRGIWIGAGAVAMQILAGHPQFGFYTGVGAGLYALLNLFGAPAPARIATKIFLMFVIGAALAAAQLWPGLALAGETVRARLDPQAAGAASLPPEYITGLIAPGFFGPLDYTSRRWEFWGRTQFWEGSIFVGVTILSLAIFACGNATRPRRRFAATLAVLSLLVAMGQYTPLFRVMYHVPGFANFRAWGRFSMLTGIFLAMLSALGFDRLMKGARPGHRPAALLGVMAILLFAGACTMVIEGHRGVSGLWGKALGLRSRLSSHAHFDVTSDFVQRTAHTIAIDLLRAGAVATVLAVLWWAVRRDRRAAYLMVILAAMELIGFARRFRPTFDWATFNAESAETAQRLHAIDGSDRTWWGMQDVAIRFDCPDGWGYDATILQRYADMVDEANNISLATMLRWGITPIHESPLWRLLRVRSFVAVQPGGYPNITPQPEPVLNRVMLLPDWHVVSDRGKIIEAVKNRTFDPGQTALLENPVAISRSGSGSAGAVKYRDINSDAVELTIDAKRPAIMVLTDNYATGWKVTPVGAPGQNSYEVIPVDGLLRGIPVVPGTHHLLMQYRPRAIAVGACISAVTLVSYVLSGAVAMLFSRRGSKRARSATPVPGGSRHA
jgi:hypothetical protein